MVGCWGERAGRAVMNVSDSFPRPSEVVLSAALSERWLLCKVLCISVLDTQASFAVQLNCQNLGLFPQLPTWCPVYLQTHQRSSLACRGSPTGGSPLQLGDMGRSSIGKCCLQALFEGMPCVPVLSTQVSHIITGQHSWQMKLLGFCSLKGKKEIWRESLQGSLLSGHP